MILDATCGLKQMWFQKDAEDVVYLDMRNGKIEYNEEYLKKNPDKGKLIIKPTIQADNRFLPFRAGIFDMVVYDPPHFFPDKTNFWGGDLYGVLHPITWTMDLSKAIKELFRVLKPNGFLIFRWSEHTKTLKEALYLFPCEPLFGTNINATKHKTWWIVFRKD